MESLESAMIWGECVDWMVGTRKAFGFVRFVDKYARGQEHGSDRSSHGIGECGLIRCDFLQVFNFGRASEKFKLFV